MKEYSLSTQTTNLPPDVGLCTACSARNSKRASRCHACQALLSWAPQPKAEKPKTAKAASTPRISAPVVSSEAATLWGIGLVVFIASLFLPFVGWWLYRYFSNEESPLANFAAAGGVLGVALIGLGVMGHAATVGKPPTP